MSKQVYLHQTFKSITWRCRMWDFSQHTIADATLDERSKIDYPPEGLIESKDGFSH